MKRVSVTVLACGLVFGILSTWLGPKMIAYWYAPPVPSGAASAFNCTDAVQWAMRKLVWTQVAGTMAGLVIGLVLGLVMRRKGEPPAAPAAPASKPA